MRQRSGERLAARIAIALALSLGMNVAIWAFLGARGAFTLPEAPPTVRPVTMAPLARSEWEANRAVKPEPKPPPAVAQRRDEPKGEIVELPDDGRPSQAPDESRYLSDRDRRVERETVSRYADNTPNLLPVPQPGSPGRDAAGEGGRAERSVQREGEEAKGVRARKEKAAPQKKAAPEGGEKLALAPPASRERETAPDETARQDEEPPSPTPGPERLNGPTKPDLSLGPETKSRLMGGPGMAGFGQVEEGDVTALNTRDGGEIARYYIRASWKIEPDWVRRVRQVAAERDPDGRLFFYKERSVVVGATLDRDGNLTEVSVVRSSNVDFYDGVALSSIRQAQPFPPPPASMLFDGRAKMAWTFTLYPAQGRQLDVTGRPWR